ncbi:Os01g0606050 [Oryza sativa Japonica Group]|uniref:Os01g0606050 protein n=1 Tax=Oryza sativa subsp. japonica TaxID=39947 RepID=C7IX39_ORYSJ|nr:Os01g0606050 [Oryza sativa Japonica Group]|eukprot:NP_001172456.1 Os01g0606050 [Oryza sativa Japonica Group]
MIVREVFFVTHVRGQYCRGDSSSVYGGIVVWDKSKTRAGISRGDQFYASYPAGTELLTDTAKLYKAALGNCFEIDDWGPIEFSIMAKHFDRQGKPPYAYHAMLPPLRCNVQIDIY